jgi:hypothetical protein
MMRSWMRAMCGGLVGAMTLVTLVGCGSNGLNAVNPNGFNDKVELVRRGPGGTTRFLGRNVVYRLDKHVAMTIDEMNADILLKDPSLPYVPANKNDYSIQVHYAKVTKDAASLAALMNTYVFNDEDSPLKDLKITFKDDRIVMAGKMKKGVWVGFEMEGTVAPSPDGKIVMTPKVIKSMGMRVDGLMSLIGIEMAKLMKMKEEKGLILSGNNIIMDPAKLYPPPTLLGRVTRVGVANGLLTIEMNDGRAKPWPEMPVNPKACMVMWGGDVLINTNLVLNAKIIELDATPDTPMVFALDFYREQLEAGYVVSTKAGHMLTYLPDVNTYTGNMGRFTPPSFPIPGMIHLPSDMNQDEAGMEESEEDENQPKARRK